MQRLPGRISIRRFLFTIMSGLAGVFLVSCDSLYNKIDSRNFSCGPIEGDLKDYSWVQLQNEKAETLDLNQSMFSIVDSNFQPLPESAYRVSAKGCLGVPKQQEFIVRVPGKKVLFTRLEAGDKPLQLLAVQSLESPLKVGLEPSRSVYQGKTTVRVRSSDRSKSRYCLEELNQLHCIRSSDLNAAAMSQEFLSLGDSLDLPAAEGRYRLHILSEARDGSLSLNPFDFTIDNTAPRVIPDFAERLPALSYFGQSTYFVEPGYPIKFVSVNDTLAGTHIEYCLVPAENAVSACANPLVYGVENPLLIASGASRLVYRTFDAAGNGLSEGWQSVSIQARKTCKVVDFLQSLTQVHPLTCQVLEGDLDLTLMDPKAFPLLDQFIEVTGRILYQSETATSVPGFQNLHAAFGIDINLGAELPTDFTSFPQLRQLKELTLRLSMGGRSVDAFNDIKQMLRINLANIENVKELRVLRSLQTVDDYLWIYSLDTMTNLDFLSRLTRAGHLRIRLCDELRDLKALKNLTSVATIEITTNPKLTSLEGLEGVVFIEKLVLSGLGIRDFTGLQNLKEVTFGLWVESNPQLVSVKGLESLQKLSYFLFRNNDRLPAGTQLLGQTI